MSPEVALEYINAAKNTTYTVGGNYIYGEYAQAFRVSSADGKNDILKINANPAWRKQVERARAATGHLKALGYPVPDYPYIDSMNEGTFWLETMLAGDVTEAPSTEQTTDLIRLVNLQQGQVTSELQGQDWCWYAAGVVFRGDSGLVRSLMQFSPETSALAAQIEGMVLGLDGKVLSNSDLVHGNLTLKQVLVQDHKVSGVLGWDQVGYGDRALDLVSLWYSVVLTPGPREQILEAALACSDIQSVKIFAAYKMLSSVASAINTSGGEVTTAAQQAKAGLQILSQYK